MSIEKAMLAETRKRLSRARKRRTKAAEVPKAKAAFLQFLRTGLSVSMSAQKAKLDRTTVYHWKDADPEFAKAWGQAWEEGADLMEDEMLRRGRDGYEEPLAFQGHLTGDTVRKFSDVLLIVSHKLRRPHLHREYQKVEHSGPDGGPIRIEDPRKALFDLLERKRARIGRLTPTGPGPNPASN